MSFLGQIVGLVITAVGAIRLMQLMRRRTVRRLLHPEAVAVEDSELSQHIRWAVVLWVGCAVGIASPYLL